MQVLLERLRIENYRNLVGEEISFSGLNFLLGPNGAGKSSVLEAFYLVCTGRSPRPGVLRNLSNRGSQAFRCLPRSWEADHRSVLS